MKLLTKIVLILVWLGVITTPPTLFILTRGGLPTNPLELFPVFGLLAFTLIWGQIMLGLFMGPLSRLFPKIFPVHIVQGLTALLFALLHPLLLIIGATPAVYLTYGFIDPALKGYVFLGQGALLLLIIGVSAGLLRKSPKIKAFWRKIHYVNYVVFFLAFTHSWNVGTDLSISWVLDGLWIFMLATVVIGLIYKKLLAPKQLLSRATVG